MSGQFKLCYGKLSPSALVGIYWRGINSDTKIYGALVLEAGADASSFPPPLFLQ
jgi:hypothetical protein